MQLIRVVTASQEVRHSRSRTRKIETLARLLCDTDPADAAWVTAWLAGLLPQGRIGVGGAAVREVETTPSARDSTLRVADVHAAFDAIATISGKGATQRRRDTLERLLGRATEAEQRFLIALLLGELRQGALEGLMVEAVARAADVPAERVRRAWMFSGDLAQAASAAFLGGVAALDGFRLTPFRPLQPMLAQPAADPGDALGRSGEVLARSGALVFEYKLDGARIQVHRDGSRVRVFSRQLNDVTRSVPEIVAATLALPVERVVLDGEAIAVRPDGRPHPFQVTMRRFLSTRAPGPGDRDDAASPHDALPLRAAFFDCLLVDDVELVDRPLHDRLVALDRVVPEALRVPRVHTAEESVADAFFDEALAAGHEGLLAKDPSAPWSAGSRGSAWLKIKQAHTLDLVVLAAEWGSGRREGRLSNLHLGARHGAGFVMLGKTFKGLTDAMLDWQTDALLAREVSRKDHVVWVRPELVVEIAFHEVQDSPRYPAGLALRFARVKGYRTDKSPEEADTLETVRRIHQVARAD